MDSKKFDLLGPAFADIGHEVVRIAGERSDGILLYAEAGEGWVEPSVFVNEPESIRYVEIGGPTLDFLIMDAWDSESADKRWTAMRYIIDQGEFHASFDFDNLEHSDETTLDRRTRAVHARFGDKPIVYPPLPEGAVEYRPGN